MEEVFTGTASAGAALGGLTVAAAPPPPPGGMVAAGGGGGGGGMPGPGGAGAGRPPPVDAARLKTYLSLYPCYVNVTRKVSQGRRLPMHMLAGCINPFPLDLAEACVVLGFRSVLLEVRPTAAG